MEKTFEIKPIEKVNQNLLSINQMLNQMKIDMVCIKSEIAQIKDFIKEKEKQQEFVKVEKSKGWFY
tara:strand:- start:1297 stop:1494 length:198 start_codon:yes stop_codon:yes gene_type:complete